MKITDEQKERANLVNLPQFLMSHGFDLKKVGKEYVWKEHDSLHIKDNGPGECGQWFRFSENKGGDNIGLLREYMDMSFIDAVEALTGEHKFSSDDIAEIYDSGELDRECNNIDWESIDDAQYSMINAAIDSGIDMNVRYKAAEKVMSMANIAITELASKAKEMIEQISVTTKDIDTESLNEVLKTLKDSNDMANKIVISNNKDGD